MSDYREELKARLRVAMGAILSARHDEALDLLLMGLVLAPKSAVLWRDCDECDGTGAITAGNATEGQWLEGTREEQCSNPSCVNGRVRVGVCWVEPDEVDGISGEIASILLDGMTEAVLHFKGGSTMTHDYGLRLVNRILALFGVKGDAVGDNASAG